MAQFAQRFSFNLANALACDSEHLTDFFEGARIAVLKAKTHAEMPWVRYPFPELGKAVRMSLHFGVMRF